MPGNCKVCARNNLQTMCRQTQRKPADESVRTFLFDRQINAVCGSTETTGGSMDIIEKTNTTDSATKAAMSAFLQHVSARSDFTGAILFGSRAPSIRQ